MTTTTLLAVTAADFAEAFSRTLRGPVPDVLALDGQTYDDLACELEEIARPLEGIDGAAYVLEPGSKPAVWRKVRAGCGIGGAMYTPQPGGGPEIGPGKTLLSTTPAYPAVDPRTNGGT